MGNYNLA
jgi:hypothetical protein